METFEVRVNHFEKDAQRILRRSSKVKRVEIELLIEGGALEEHRMVSSVKSDGII